MVVNIFIKVVVNTIKVVGNTIKMVGNTIKLVSNTIKVVGLQPKVVSIQLMGIAMLTKAFGILPIVLLNMVAYNKQVIVVLKRFF